MKIKPLLYSQVIIQDDTQLAEKAHTQMSYDLTYQY